MNKAISKVIYRGFSPKVFDVVTAVSKPEVIYRGFKVAKDLYERKIDLSAITLIYRGVISNPQNDDMAVVYAYQEKLA